MSFNNITTKLQGSNSLADELMSSTPQESFSPSAPPVIPQDTELYVVPSNGMFYNGVKAVSLSLLTMGQVVDVEKVYACKDAYEQFTKFVGIVNGSVYGVPTLELTLQDFYAVCYWLRLNSYKKEPITIQMEVEDANGVPKTMIGSVLSDSIEAISLNNFISNPEYDYPRVRDQLFAMQYSAELSNIEKTYFPYVAGGTPEEKLANFRAMRADKFDALNKYIYDSYHGVKTMAKIKLPDGEIREQELKFEFTMYFPRSIREGFYSNLL
jgi:hypothetical protein